MFYVSTDLAGVTHTDVTAITSRQSPYPLHPCPSSPSSLPPSSRFDSPFPPLSRRPGPSPPPHHPTHPRPCPPASTCGLYCPHLLELGHECHSLGTARLPQKRQKKKVLNWELSIMFPNPGNIFATPAMLPMLETSFDCTIMKSSRPNLAFAIFSRIQAASALVTSAEALSTREIMSPMPRMCNAIQLG